MFRPEPVFSGEVARVQAAPELVQHLFQNNEPAADSQRWVVADEDVFFVYVLLDPTDVTEQVMVQFFKGNWEHRAYWGANKIPFGRGGTPRRQRLGELPERNVWVRLEVPAAEVGLAAGDTVTGWAFTQFGGKVYWDRAGVLTKASPQANTDSLQRWAAAQRLTNGARLPEQLRPALAADQPTVEQQRALRNHFIVHVWKATRSTFDPLLKKLDEHQQRRRAAVAGAPTTLVYKELPQPKPAFLLERGEYDKPGAAVDRATPAVLFRPSLARSLVISI